MTAPVIADEVQLPTFDEVHVDLTSIPARTAAFLWPGTQAGEGLRAVATRLKTGPMAALIRTLAVTSCIGGDGKTSIALGLAATFAQAGFRTVAIDADLRRRSTAQMLGIEPTVGLAEWLEASHSCLPLARIAPAGFHLVAAGVGPCRPELLGSSRMLRLLNALERRFDRIILDCAPVLPVADTLALSDRVGGFILVVRAQHTPRESVVRVASLLGVDRLLGLILNGYENRLPRGGRGHYGYGYGYGYGQGLGSPHGRAER